MAQWGQALGDAAWHRIDVRDGAKGSLVVDVVKRRVVSRTPRRQQGDEEMLVVRRYRGRDQPQGVQVDVYLSHAAPETPLGQFARVAKAEHRIEECLQRSKSEAGLADYEPMVLGSYIPDNQVSILQTKRSDREGHEAIRIGL